MAKRPQRPRDFAQLGKLIVDMATGQAPSDAPIAKESLKAVAGRKGGLKGGKGRAEKLSSAKRKSIATKAARARWRSASA